MTTEYNTLNGENRADSRAVQEKLTGDFEDATWHFDDSNQVIVEFSNKTIYEVQYDLATKKLSVKDTKVADAWLFTLDNTDPNTQVFAVQNFG